MPHLIIDRTKYKGRGRPRKEDYRIYPDPDGSDLIAGPQVKIELDKKDPWKYKTTFEIKCFGIMSNGDGS